MIDAILDSIRVAADTASQQAVPVEQDRLIRLSIILTPVFIALLAFAGSVIAFLTRRMELAARTERASHGQKLAHIEKAVNSQTDDREERINQLTAALVKAKVAVPPRSAPGSAMKKKKRRR